VSRRVVITIPHLAPWGTEAQTLLLARALVEGGWTVRVCCFYGHDAGVLAAFRGVGAEVIEFGLRREDGLIRLLRRLRAELARERADVLHVQYLTPGLPALVAGRLAGVPRIYATVHQTGTGYGLRERFLMRAGTALCSTVFCVSGAVEESWFGSRSLLTEAMTSRPPRHCTLYNALAPEAGAAPAAGCAAVSRAACGLAGSTVVGVVGRLTPEKGHETLVAALPAIVACHPGARLLVVGSGPEESRLRAQAEALGVAAAVTWTGWRAPAELAALRAAMTVAVVPSTREGFGLAAAEAAAAGLPVVATAVGGLPEVVADGVTGLLVPAGDAGALARAIVRLLDDEGLRRRLGAGGRRLVAERFSYERYARLVGGVYNPGARG
jgi:glycosyltransferase involved in cell wall biosynthesis